MLLFSSGFGARITLFYVKLLSLEIYTRDNRPVAA